LWGYQEGGNLLFPDTYLTWCGNACKVVNVGKYRRGANHHTAPISQETIDDSKKQKRGEVGACDANFYFLFLIPTTKKQQSYVKKLP
jgi:hypothetical protein